MSLIGSLAFASFTKMPPRSFIIVAHASMKFLAVGPHSTEKVPVTAIVPPILISRAWARASGAKTWEPAKSALTTTIRPRPSTRDLIPMSVPPSQGRSRLDSPVGLPDALGAPELRARALHDDLPRFQQVGPVRDLQGLHDVLLHQQDAEPLLVERLQDPKQLLHQEGREPQ